MGLKKRAWTRLRIEVPPRRACSMEQARLGALKWALKSAPGRTSDLRCGPGVPVPWNRHAWEHLFDLQNRDPGDSSAEYLQDRDLEVEKVLPGVPAPGSGHAWTAPQS